MTVLNLALVIFILSIIAFELFRRWVRWFQYDISYRWFYRNIYLNSLHWKLVRWVKRKTSVYKCAKCNARTHLDLHHKTYEHMWWEFFHLSDLQWLCRKHHNEIHGQGGL